MNRVTLDINGQQVDTNQQDVDVTLSYSIESIVPGNIEGAHSKRNVKLPATKSTIQLFEYVTEPGSTGTAGYKFQPATLKVDGLPILTGKARLNSVETRANAFSFEPEQFNVGLIGNNADWFADVGNLLIRNLDWETVTISVSEVEQNRDPLTNEYAWILVKYQEWQRETSVTHTEFTPALFVWQILERAFNSQGYQLNSVFTSDPFNRLVIPTAKNLDADYLRDNVNLRASTTTPWTFTVVTPEYFPQEEQIQFDDETTDPNFDFGGNYSSGVYTVPITALYETIAEVNVNITALSGDPLEVNEVSLIFKVNGDLAATYALSAGHDWNNVFEFNASIVFEYIQDLEQGDTVELYLLYQGVTLTASVDGFLSIQAEKESFELEEVYDLTAFIPSTWYVRDLINDLTFIFNLAWETDVAGGQVYAYPKDDYYLTYRADASGAITTSGFGGFFHARNPYDLNRREIQGGQLDIIDRYKRNTVLAYATDDPTTEAEEKRRGVNIYSGGYQFPLDRFDNGIEFLYTSWFAKTIQINDVDITATSAAYGVQIPLVYGDDYNTAQDAKPNYYFAPKLLYYAGRREGLDGYVNMYYETSSASSAFDYPAAFVTNYIDPSAGDWSLSFSDEATNYLAVVPGLFKTFHLQEFKRREIGKRYTVNAMWNKTDIVNLSFRNKARIGSSNFILQSVEYNPLRNKPQKTVILYDEKPNVNDLLKVTNTVSLAGANPQPGTLTGSGSGLVGASAVSVNIQLSRTLFSESMTNVLVLPASSGILAVSNTYANVLVFQNGQKMLQDVQYTISGTTITISTDAHYDTATYEVIVNGVTKG